MSFQDAACWVFGFTGYTDDSAAAKVGKVFEACGTKASKSPDAAMANFLALLEDARLMGTSFLLDGHAVPITIYGSFQSKADRTPSHVWIVCAGHLFETWVGEARLFHEKATDKSTFSPTNSNIHREGRTWHFGKVASSLTNAQYKNMADQISEIHLAQMGLISRRRH